MRRRSHYSEGQAPSGVQHPPGACAVGPTVRAVATLDAFIDCALAPVTNSEGDAYDFNLGFLETVGTGVGCVDIDGSQQLVGLDITDDVGTTVGWTRTVIELDGTRARNGEVTKGAFTRPRDDAEIELLRDITCGDRTIVEDGLYLSD